MGLVRIKICGIRTVDDALAAIDAGADLIGLNFVPSSKRFLDVRQAVEISEAVGTQVERVALFRNAYPEEIDKILSQVEVDRVQLHGEEGREEVERVEYPVIKAVPGANPKFAERYPGVILLLDHPESGGGQGNPWEWSESEELISMGVDVILAGGLDPDNVGPALDSLKEFLPWGVDVATGVENSDGFKSPEKMRAFVESVRKVEQGE